MPSLKRSSPLLTAKEYLEGESYAEVRHEYIDGAAFVMAGGTLNHNRISGNIFASLDDSLNGSPCRPYISDVKVKVKTLVSEAYYYPDVVVTCEQADSNDQFLENPTTIFEVLSESTERNEKFLAYKNINSLQEYILVSQDRKEITVARKKNNWQAEILTGDDFILPLSCAAATINCERIYRNVDFNA